MEVNKEREREIKIIREKGKKGSETEKNVWQEKEKEARKREGRGNAGYDYTCVKQGRVGEEKQRAAS